MSQDVTPPQAHLAASPSRAGAEAPAAAPRSRTENRSTSQDLLRIGVRKRPLTDLYLFLLTSPWSVLFALMLVLYLGGNLAFALAYLLDGGIENARPGNFADAYFFSVQTMATIGYGQLVPQTVYANILVTIEALTGMLFIALTTGLMFARFSRPTARILFSKVAVIGAYDGVATLFVRAGNERQNQILRADVSMHFLRTEVSREGATMRRFYDMKLVRDRTPLFGLTFLMMHVIDASSPLFGLSAESCAMIDGEIVVTISGLDETMSQTIHARTSYTATEIRWNHRFIDIFGFTDDGRRAIDFGRFHDTIAL